MTPLDWLPAMVVTRPALGPHAVDLLERFPEILAGHPAPVSRKREAFGLLNAMTAMFVQNELAAVRSRAGSTGVSRRRG
ncbi:hypothetical protein [Microbispora siamensis]|uniref:Uncharacterized protein n=1 Tax=Microbispora siamensis TaxID=564413 RepID=A0ABQ4GKE8_9ACTN|nr:hypothetical protein [Microbispora siamensis]GIH61894.1 hypothetical protein Msi02_27110 [Microbispora siamensis]